MADLNRIAAQLTDELKRSGVVKYAFELSESQKRELNTEQDHFSLYRTIFGYSASVTAFLGGRKGSASGNDLTEEGLKQLVSAARAAAECAPEDPANDIAECQAPETFRCGPWEADMDRYYDRVQEALDTIRTEYPAIRISQVIASHDQTRNLYQNSNGVRFEAYDGDYTVFLEYAGSAGARTTGLAYSQLVMKDLETPILDHGLLRKQLSDTEKSLNTVSIADKFEGTVIFTPDALGSFAWMLVDNFLSSGVIMDGTSLWKDRAGEKVADARITLRLQAEDPRLAVLPHYTEDGYKAENVTLIENGVLNSFLLNLYAANKTGRPVTKNSGASFVLEPGGKPLEDIIRSVKRGLVVGGFSGGTPGSSGEFSGVAKNSFYIENGEIKGAVMKTMINGNLTGVFQNVVALSQEQFSDGMSAFPYLAAEGITISGN